MANLTGAFLAVVLIGLIAGLVLQSLFLLWGARIAGIDHRSFGLALATTILGGVASFIFSLALSAVAPGIGTVGGTLLGFFVSALIAMPLFRTTYGKALGATILAWVLGIVILGGIALVILLIGGFALVAPP
jgi:hypothetical protein